ncbi:uncharacterized protein LOC131852267 isoform X2 [Achroia grisella]|uniref:uncharacterized protein LOC131852267 isoform X2 n=1 Tax=Achroia grisella TaxID=688607 RepID=UPI0027D2323B|nr:uncharacterized protein LOC131852267 isoform X2 [Achroia grisella]
MITYQNCEVVASFFFYITVKFLSVLFEYYNPMYKKRAPTLTSIPERNENEEVRKWVPKKKHEVLKAKYKCLKKLFQIYDASVIGILPEPCQDAESIEETEIDVKQSKRKKRSNRTKTDACAGTIEVSNGDVTEQSESERGSTIATAVMRDLKMTQCSCTSTQYDGTISKYDTYATTQVSKENVTERECDCTQTHPTVNPNPYLLLNGKPKITRFQWFIQRIFGIRGEYKNFSNGHVYAASDNNITHQYGEKRRRRGLRFRRLKRPKKIQSESGLRSVRSPAILTFVQSVQRSCLMDTTPRQCPIVGCIINYNDHLNLCHFTGRKYICHYCHEGFEREYDKYVHENDHIGITKLNITSAPSTDRQSSKKASNTQTDPQLTKINVQEEKLKKIVSFFDKITDPEQVITQIKKDRFSESNLRCHRSKMETTIDNITSTDNSSDGDKRTVSCVNLRRKNNRIFNNYISSGDSDFTSQIPVSQVTCNFCGENFEFRRQLSLHMDLEHRTHNKYSKFHSCAGITNPKRCEMLSEDGKVNILSEHQNPSTIRRINTCSTLTQDSEYSRNSEETLRCDPSTNIVYYSSSEAAKPSMESFVNRGGYKWEPGTKIIHV